LLWRDHDREILLLRQPVDLASTAGLEAYLQPTGEAGLAAGGLASLETALLSWGAYLASALVWLWYDLQKGHKNIYLPCIGWILLDSAVIVGASIYG
jgi:hypothetical protein